MKSETRRGRTGSSTRVASAVEAVGRFALPLALCAILIGAIRISATYHALSITGDEAYHFSCGLDYLATRRVCAPENPPLEPVASAVLPYLDGARPDPVIQAQPGARFEIGRNQLWALLQRSSNPWGLIARMRAGVLPFFIACSLCVFFGVRRYFGRVEAALATLLFTLIPSVLAHAGVATTDIALTATLTAALFALLWWNEAPTARRAVWLGVAVGLAVFSKFSALGYLPAVAVAAILWHIATARPSGAEWARLVRQRAGSLALAAGVAVVVLWAGCLFSIGRVEGWPAWLRTPAPELFSAFRELLAHSRRGHQTYLLGSFGHTGSWSFYPVTLFVKTPIALLLAGAAGLWVCWEQRRGYGWLPVAWCAGILLVAMASPIQIGVRHVLPLFVGLSVMGALGLIRLARVSVLIPAALVVWMAISGIRAHPDYLAYFNEFAADRPEDFVIDSDLEWDQSWEAAGRFLRAHGATEVTLDLGHIEEIPARLYGLPAVHNATQTEFLTRGGVPRPGWHIINVDVLRIVNAQLRLHPSDPSAMGQLVAFKGPAYGLLKPEGRSGGLLFCYYGPGPG